MSDDDDQVEVLNDAPEQPAKNQLMRRGFDGIQLASEGPATQALVAKATADIQARWVMAMRRPRNIDDVRQQIMIECRRPGFAKGAIYKVPRGSTTIKGLSIRFAEVAMRCMGNLGCEANTIFDSDEERIIRVTATDFETNATWTRDITVKKTVERKDLKRGQRSIRDRINSYGDRIFIVEATDDDVATKEAALISKASRTAILRLVPGHIREEAMLLCEKTMSDTAAKDPAAEKNQILDAFAAINIMPSMIAEWLGHPIEQTNTAELVELRLLFGAIRGEGVTWAEAMEHAEEARVRAKVATQKAHAAAKDAAAKEAAAKGTAPATETAQPASNANAAPTSQTAPAAAGPKSGGRGAQSVKDKIIAKDAPPAEAKPAETKPAEKKAEEKKAETAAAADGPKEERNCFMCGVPILVPESAPGGQQCDACKAS